MTYNAKYKLPGQWFWRKLKNIKGDCVEGGHTRVIILEDETQIHLPVSAIVLYSRKRFEHIRQKMEQQAGQVLPVKEG